MFLKCYSGLRSSPVTHKQHSDYAVSSDKLRVMTRDGSGCSEGEYLAYLALTGSPLSGRGNSSDLREVPHFFQLIVYLVYLVGRINLRYLLLLLLNSAMPVEGSNHSLFLVGQISFISENSNVRLAIAGSRIIWKSEPTPTVGIRSRRHESNSVIPGFRIN